MNPDWLERIILYLFCPSYWELREEMEYMQTSRELSQCLISAQRRYIERLEGHLQLESPQKEVGGDGE